MKLKDLKEVQEIVHDLLKKNEECTKPTAYVNGYHNGLVEFLEELNKRHN